LEQQAFHHKNWMKNREMRLGEEKISQYLKHKQNRYNDSRDMQKLLSTSALKLSKVTTTRDSECKTCLLWLEEYEDRQQDTSDDEKYDEKIHKCMSRIGA